MDSDDHTLRFEYVDRELVLARMTGGVTYEDGSPATSGKRVDLLLKSTDGGIPVVGEVKIRGDKNPFYALIQSLMYAAELCTTNQLARVADHYETFERSTLLEDEDTLGLVDILIVLADYNRRSRVRRELLERTEDLCAALSRSYVVQDHVRRFSCVEARLQEGRHLEFSRVFAFPDDLG